MYQNIMVPLDGSQLAECVLPQAKSIARGCGVNNMTFIRIVDLTRIPVVSETSSSGVQEKLERARELMESEEKDEAERYLAGVIKSLNLDATNVRTVVMKGSANECLLDYAQKNGVDLIIIATHGRSGISRWIWGSVTDRILRGSLVPVLLVRPPGCIPGVR